MMTSPELTAVLWEDHEARIRVLERKHRFTTALISAVTSVVCTVLAGLLAGCGVRGADPAFPTPAEVRDVREATVRIGAVDALNPGRSWMATGWFADADTVVTAGHVCEPFAMYTVTVEDGTEALAWATHDDDERDLCTLDVLGYESRAWLRPAKRAPELGDRVFYVGYPNAHLASADGKIATVSDTWLTASIHGTFGASGSALVNEDGEVVGVLHGFWYGDENTLIFARVGAALESDPWYRL